MDLSNNVIESDNGESGIEILEVRPPEDEEDLNNNLHPYLPQAPSLVLIFGSVRSGKSNLISNLLLRNEMWRSRADAIKIISPSAMNDNSMRFVREEENIEILDTYDESWLRALIEYQNSCSKEERDKIILIADDAIDYYKRNSALAFLSTRYRHFGIIYYVIVAQSYKVLDPKVRNNCRNLIIMKCPNTKMLNDIAEEYDCMLGGNFKKLYAYAVLSEMYSFLHIDLGTNPPTAYKQFKQKIFCGKWLIPEPNVDTENLLAMNEE